MTLHDKMDSIKADEEIDDSEEDENDSALDSSTSCESQWITQINLFTTQKAKFTILYNCRWSNKEEQCLFNYIIFWRLYSK